MEREEFELLFRMEARQNRRRFPVLETVKMEWKNACGEILALASPSHGEIWFNPDCLNMAYSAVLDVIRHELAHLIDYDERGRWEENGRDAAHGKNWRRICREIGYSKPSTRIRYYSAKF